MKIARGAVGVSILLAAGLTLSLIARGSSKPVLIGAVPIHPPAVAPLTPIWPGTSPVLRPNPPLREPTWICTAPMDSLPLFPPSTPPTGRPCRVCRMTANGRSGRWTRLMGFGCWMIVSSATQARRPGLPAAVCSGQTWPRREEAGAEVIQASLTWLIQCLPMGCGWTWSPGATRWRW